MRVLPRGRYFLCLIMVYCLQNGNDYTGEWLKKEKIMLQNKEERENFWKLCGEHDRELL